MKNPLLIALTLVLSINFAFSKSPVKKISCYSRHALLLKENGSLYGVGENHYGQLGDGSTTLRISPVYVLGNVKDVSTSRDHTIALLNDGSVWACGSSFDYRFGEGFEKEMYLKPVRIATGAKAAFAGEEMSFVLKNDDSLWLYGRIPNDSLFEGTPQKIFSNVKKASGTGRYICVVKRDGTLWSIHSPITDHLSGPSYDFSPWLLMRSVSDISMINGNLFILKIDGTLWGMGDNGAGELGVGYKTPERDEYIERKPVKIMDNVLEISTSYDHTVALKRDGTLWGWGSNYLGQLGFSNFEIGLSRTDPIITPVKISDNVKTASAGDGFTFYAKNNNKLMFLGTIEDDYVPTIHLGEAPADSIDFQ